MIEEIQLINYWLNSKDFAFLEKHELNPSYFIATQDIVKFINQYIHDYKDFPTYELLCEQFENFKKIEELDNLQYLIDTIKEQKAYVEYKQSLLKSVDLINEGKTFEAISLMQSELEKLIKAHTSSYSKYDWVKDAELRFEEYMKRHTKGEIKGLPIGHSKFDEITGGIMEDDLILLVGRTNEGKSLMATYFAYKVWEYLHKNNIDRPVVYISTEMSEFEMSFRLDTLKAHFSNKALNLGKLSNPDVYKEYLEDLKQLTPSFIILTEEHNKGRKFTPFDIRRIIEVEKPALIVIDQLYDLRDTSGEKDIRKRIINIVEIIRQINLTTKTPMLLVAQANRQAAINSKKDNEAVPELENIQESDNPAQKSTKVLTMKRIDKSTIKLSLKKNRSGERDIDFYFKVDIDLGIWEAIDDELTSKF